MVPHHTGQLDQYGAHSSRLLVLVLNHIVQLKCQLCGRIPSHVPAESKLENAHVSRAEIAMYCICRVEKEGCVCANVRDGALISLLQLSTVCCIEQTSATNCGCGIEGEGCACAKGRDCEAVKAESIGIVDNKPPRGVICLCIIWLMLS